MRSLAGSLADDVLADPFKFPPPTDTTNHYKEGKGSTKKVWKLVTEKRFTRK